MKKILLILTASFVGFSAFGQGYFAFSGQVGGTVWQGFQNDPAIRGNANMNVAFLWATSGSTALITSIQGSVPTNATSANQTWSLAGAWSAILTDPNYHLATNASGSTLVTAAVSTTGSWNYGSTFGATGTAANTAYSLYVIAWNIAYATPQLAAANNSAVGWSSIFNYTTVDSFGTAATMPASGLARFGAAAPAAVPEPSTMVLAGLGAASLLLFRRRK